jgi:uncharacterized protein YbaR (Trm112 family)
LNNGKKREKCRDGDIFMDREQIAPGRYGEGVAGCRVRKFLNTYFYLHFPAKWALMTDDSTYGKDHAFTCPYCGLKWRTIETGPKLHCKKCNRWFPNPWAEPAPEK